MGFELQFGTFVPTKCGREAVVLRQVHPSHRNHLPRAIRAVLEELLLPAVEDRGLGVAVCRTALKSARSPEDALSGSRLSLPACNASVASSSVRSIILTSERFLHFQLNRYKPRPDGIGSFSL
jgi:hypothetical protein